MNIWQLQFKSTYNSTNKAGQVSSMACYFLYGVCWKVLINGIHISYCSMVSLRVLRGNFIFGISVLMVREGMGYIEHHIFTFFAISWSFSVYVLLLNGSSSDSWWWREGQLWAMYNLHKSLKSSSFLVPFSLNGVNQSRDHRQWLEVLWSWFQKVKVFVDSWF